MTHGLRILWTLLLIVALRPDCAAAQSAYPTVPEDKSTATILVYHRIGEDSYPATNIRLEQFESQIAALVQGDYNIIALPALVKALKNSDPLPPRSVALSFDGGHRSILDHAVPLLLKYHMPFTLFLPTDRLDSGRENFMSWSDIKKLTRHKDISFGLQAAAYQHLETNDETALRQQINKAHARYREEMGAEPTLFAYPFGENSALYKDITTEHGFTAAFGEQSGPTYSGQDLFDLPRFPMTENYAGLDRFQLITNTLPLPITARTPADNFLTQDITAIGFTLPDALAAQNPQISCFVDGQDQPTIEMIGTQRVELRLHEALSNSRNRINCTLPAPVEGTDSQRWRWLGLLFTRTMMNEN